MENDDDDFTFCQVAPLDEEKVVQNISGINIKDAPSTETSSRLNNSVSWKDRSDASESRRTVGSLSFNVIDASPGKQMSESHEKRVLEDTGSSASALPQQKIPARKPTARSKVPFEKGYSQMDWLKLTRTHPDLAGLKGLSNKRCISLSEVKQHQTGDAMWTVLKGHVYNIAPYMKFHPGGVDMLMKAVGKDCTSLFNKYHAWVNSDFLLEKCLVGILDDSK